jgi:2-keto-4-pentenoate hydratase
MERSKINRAAEMLASAWREHRQISEFPEDCRPTNREQAYAVQDEMARLVGSRVVGWKLGMTSASAMREWGIDCPLPGRLFENALFQEPAVISASGFGKPMVEPEFAVRIGSSICPRVESYKREEVVNAVAAVHLAIEIGDFRLAKRPLSPLEQIADNSGFGAFIVGPEVPDWYKIDFKTIPVQLMINGHLVASGFEGDGRIDPIEVVVWTLNHLCGRGIQLAAGALISTGTATTPMFMAADCEAVAVFGELGEVRLRFAERVP